MTARPPSSRAADPLARIFAAAVENHRRGRLDEAEAGYRKILAARAEQPDALNMLGVVAGQRGRTAEARDWFDRAVRADGRNPVFHYNRAMAQQAAGERDAAEKSYRRALALKPDYVDALAGLGGVLIEAGRLEEAERCCRKALRLQPDAPRLLYNLGAVLIARGAFDEAIERTRAAIARAPDYAEAHANLGTALLGIEDHAAAAEALGEAIRLKPDYAEAHHNLGLVHISEGRIEEAIACFQKAVALRPDYVEAHVSLGNTWRRLGDWVEASAAYEAALAIRPNDPSALLGAGFTLIDRGDAEGAKARFDAIPATNQPLAAAAVAGKARALALLGENEAALALVAPETEDGPLPPDKAAAFARLAAGTGRAVEARAHALEALESPGLTRDQRIALHFALGGLLDRMGEYDPAFAHYAAGNDLVATSFDPDRFAGFADRLIAAYAPERVAAMPRSANRTEAPVFIVGTPRSGTSLAEQILSCHPAVTAAGERNDIARALALIGGGPLMYERHVEALDRLERAEIEDIAARYLAATPGPERPRITDKMPYNFMHLGFIAQLFPGARIIHCRREPMDSCLSCYFQNFSQGNFQTYRLAHLGAFYRVYERMMAHWRATLDLPILDLSYEALVADIEGESRRMLDFLGLDWDPAVLRFHESKRIVNTASFDQVRRPVYDDSIARWRRYAAHLDPLRAALGPEFAPRD